MKIQNHQITPYKFPSELEELYKSFFLINEISKKRDAVAKIRSYLTKGPIPHSMEMTALLAECILDDECKNGIKLFNYEKKYPNLVNRPINGCSDMSIRLQYSMCIIKFVNGLLDPFQQGVYNISLHKLAEDLKLPNYFVESRHVSTHERLPSLEMMRVIAFRAWNWLKLEYWQAALNEYKSMNLLSIGIDDWKDNIERSKAFHQTKLRQDFEKSNPTVMSSEDLKNLDDVLKNIKKYRKMEIQENKSVVALSGEINTLKSIISKKSNETIINVLIFKNYLLLHGEKNKNLNEKQLLGIRMMWSTMLEKLTKQFIYQLWTKLFKLSASKTLVDYKQSYIEQCIIDGKSLDYFQNEGEILQASEWCVWILENIEFVDHSNISDIINSLMTDSEISKKCLPIVKTKYAEIIEERELTKKVNNIQNMMEKFWVLDSSFRKRRLSEVDDNSQLNAKKQSKQKTFLFDTFDSWTPVPFGCPP